MLPRETIVDVLEKQLHKDILSGRHASGGLLPPEREMAQHYGVTRTTLKHAFGRLLQAGLLETRHGVGTRVRDYARLGGADLLPILVKHDPRWLVEIFEVRRSVGALIASRAAEKATSVQRAELIELLAAVSASESPEEVQLAEMDVHRALGRASSNRVYALLTNTLLSAYTPVRDRLAGPFTDARAAYDRLAPVIAAVTAGDSATAHTAATEYLMATERVMLEGLGIV
ncbi:FadR/GntR family transcriptional regulator [Streptomyces sp. NPDC053431]|uniref:FadR/GntR family transcriptional regulator n=1 Tax=Streptomyces sp. NPDC053431 TaxID=3365703 RepID=UPI0037D5F0D4